MERTYSVSPRYVLIFGISIVASWVLHELAHYVAGELLGNNMVMTLNSTYPENGKYADAAHYDLVSLAAPHSPLHRHYSFLA